MATQRLCDAMLPELSRAFSVSLAQAAQVVSVFAVVYGLSQLFYGPLGDRMGKFRVVTYATMACSVGSVVALMATSLNMLVAARVLVALGAAALIPLSLAWVGDSVRYEQRQETLARLSVGSTLGIVGGQLLGGVFSDTLGWRWAFAFMTVLFAVVGLLLLTDFRRQQAAAAMAPPPAKSQPGTEPKIVLRIGFVAQAVSIVTGPWSRVVLFVSFVEGAAGFGVLAIWATHLHEHLALSLSASGGIVALFGLGGMLYMVFARWLIPRLGEGGLALLGGAVMAVFAAVLAFSKFWWLDLPASLLAGFGFFMFHNTMQTNATQMAPQARGTGVSLFSAFLFMGQSAGVLAAAALVGRLGSALTIALGGVAVLAISVYFSRALRRRHLLMAG